MSLGFKLYPSFTYLDYNSGVEKTHFGKDADMLIYGFGAHKTQYRTAGYTDEDISIYSDFNNIVMDIMHNFGGQKYVLKESTGGNIGQVRTCTTVIRLFPKKVTSVTGTNFRINFSLVCRAYDHTQNTQVPWHSQEHLNGYTKIELSLACGLYNANSLVFNTNYTPYIDTNDAWIEGIFNYPYGDSQSILNYFLNLNVANYSLKPEMNASAVNDSTAITDYCNNVENFIFTYKRSGYSDTRYYVSTILNYSASVKNWLNGFMSSANPYEKNLVPPEVDSAPVGNQDDTSDYVPIGELPSVNVYASGLVTGYNIEVANLASLSNFLWDDNFVESLPKLVNNPMDAIISLKSFPFSIDGVNSTVKIGGIDTEISARKVSQQYVLIDCGSLNIREYYGDFTDYDNTTVVINLPYVGEHVLPTDEVLESYLHLYYKVDLLSGVCMAQIVLSKNRYGTVLQGSVYNFKGNISSDIPLTGQIYGNIINALSGLFTTNIGMALNSANSIVNGERKIEINGNCSSNYGALGVQTPYIKIVSPIQNNPNSYNRDLGSYANMTETIGNLKGYTEIDAINLKINGATDDEISEIKTALYNGVVIY